MLSFGNTLLAMMCRLLQLVSNGIVYVGSNDNKLYALNATNGAVIWNFTTGGYVISSPSISNGIVYFGSYDHKVYAVDAQTGTEKWNYTTGSVVESSPVVGDGNVYVGSL